MLSPFCAIAANIRLRRILLGLTQRQVARSLGCSQPYVAQVETGTRPVSRRIAERLEILLKVNTGSYTQAVFVRGRPPLTEGARNILREIRRSQSVRVSLHNKSRAPRNPRADLAKPRQDALWPMGFYLGHRAAAQVRQLETRRRGDERFWRGTNSLHFDSWRERLLVTTIGLACTQLAGLRWAGLGCALTSANGVTGRDTSRRAYPAYLLRYQGMAVAWFSQRCVRTASGYRWPDNLLLVARRGRKVTVVVEVDGAPFHRDKTTQQRRDRELGVPVLHLDASEVEESAVLERIFEWASSLLNAAA